eukprot:g10428.t1
MKQRLVAFDLKVEFLEFQLAIVPKNLATTVAICEMTLCLDIIKCQFLRSDPERVHISTTDRTRGTAICLLKWRLITSLVLSQPSAQSRLAGLAERSLQTSSKYESENSSTVCSPLYR